MTVSTAVDAAHAKFLQGSSTTRAFYFFTTEPGWAIYAGGVWYLSEDGGFKDAYDNSHHLYMHRDNGSLVYVTNFVAGLADIDPEIWNSWLRHDAGHYYDHENDVFVQNPVTKTRYDYILGVQGPTEFQKYSQQSSPTGIESIIDIEPFLRSSLSDGLREWFAEVNSNETDPIKLLKNQLEIKYKPLPGYPGQLVDMANASYGLPTPKNIWPCNGSIITNPDTIRQMFGKAAPSISGRYVVIY